jgi:hypothetical protein
MSRQFRYRITAFLLGGLIFGAPLLANDMAKAEQRKPSSGAGWRATFSSGGVRGVSCRSRPSTESMSVPAGSTVLLVNETGHSAQLRLGGARKETVADHSATEVVFRHGTTSVLLKPNCRRADDATPMLITATPSAAAQMPDPTPAPSEGGSSASVLAATAASSPSASRGTRPDSASTVARHRRLKPARSRRGPRAQPTLPDSAVAQAAVAAAAAPGMPHGGASRVPVRSSGTPGDPVPAITSLSPGESDAPVPVVPQPDLSSAGQEALTAAPAPPSAEIAAARTVASVGPIQVSGPIGLLAVTAAVCVMGVGAAAIRTIVSQRAKRSKAA